MRKKKINTVIIKNGVECIVCLSLIEAGGNCPECEKFYPNTEFTLKKGMLTRRKVKTSNEHSQTTH